MGGYRPYKRRRGEARFPPESRFGGRGYIVCRMHGTGGGAPKGNRNAWRHGNYSAEAIETRRMVAALTKQARELVGRV